MNAKWINTVGKVYGRLTVIAETHGQGYKNKITATCCCGIIKDFYRANILSGKTISCGCFNREQTSAANTTHGLSRNSQAYTAWLTLRRRCDNKACRQYKWYGAKGISYDPHWKSFDNFLLDMGEPAIGMTLDRKKSNENYSKENCQWLTQSENSKKMWADK